MLDAARSATSQRQGRPWPVLLMVRELGAGGSERQLTEIARSLDRSRFEPHVGCFHPHGLREEELRAAGVRIVRFPVRSFYAPSTLLAAAAARRYIRRHQIQLVHTFDTPSNLFGVPAARAGQARVVVSSQRAYRSLAPGAHRHLLRITDRMVDAVVVNCEAMRRHLIEEERVPAGLIHLCYNGIDTEKFHPQRSRRLPSLGGATLVIGAVSVLRREKALHTLLDAFAEVRSMQSGLKLAIVGSGPCRVSLEARARELGLGEDCVFEPATEQVVDWLHSIDIFVLPSLSEALSNSLMEAMACGCAVAASRVGGNVELVKEGRTGMLFEAGAADDLAAVLRVLIEGESLRQELARAAARFIAQNFSVSAAAGRMGEIYAFLLGDFPAPGPAGRGTEAV